MLSDAELSVIKEQYPDNPGVLSLLTEIKLQKHRQRTAIDLIRRDVLPAMEKVRYFLLAQRPIPEECLMIDTAIAQIDGDLNYLSQDKQSSPPLG
jgi:hypothetical protein